MFTYPIDFDQFTTDEIIDIVEFLSMVEQANEGQVDPHILSHKHKRFRSIINSLSMEKQIDRDFEQLTGYSIYKTIKKYK